MRVFSTHCYLLYRFILGITNPPNEMKSTTDPVGGALCYFLLFTNKAEKM